MTTQPTEIWEDQLERICVTRGDYNYMLELIQQQIHKAEEKGYRKGWNECIEHSIQEGIPNNF